MAEIGGQTGTKMTALTKEIKETLLGESETNRVEFKDARSGLPGNLWRPITAFSNTPGGGLIVLGVKEVAGQKRKFTPVGGLDIQTLQEKTVSLMENVIQHNAPYKLRKVKVSTYNLLVLVVAETSIENKPCYNKSLGMQKGACVRVGNVNRLITEEELRSFLRYSPAYNFDKKPIETVDIKSLSETKIKNFLDKSAKRRKREYPKDQPLEKTMQNLGLVTSMAEDVYPTLAGYIIFASGVPQDIEPLSRYVVRCVSYTGKSSASKILDKADIVGPLDQQIEESLVFVLKNIRTKAKIVRSKREEYPEYPELALREVIVNALVHRDYSNTGTYVQIAIFRNRIEISNPGTLPPGITVENLKESQFSRNAVIARVMRDMDYMEEYGRGIDLIYSQMNKWGLVEPLFKNVANTFRVTLLGDDYLELNERQLKFWHVLQDKNQLTATIAHKYFPRVSRGTINIDLRGMVKMGLIRMRGSSSNSYYEPEY